MEWLGDLERAFATSLYPLRVPIAIGLLIGVVALVVLARRRGWLAAARRHPARSTLVALVFLAVAGPTAWYLGSPLIIRTALDEPIPASSPAVTPDTSPGPAATGSPTSGPPATTVPVTAAPATAAPASDPPLAAERSGTFKGADDFHFGSGTARLIEVTPGTFIVRFESFSVRNGPDLYVYLSPDPLGYADGAIELGKLKATDGNFNTDVPDGVDIGSVRSVVIWCKQFAVQFAVAKLG